MVTAIFIGLLDPDLEDLALAEIRGPFNVVLLQLYVSHKDSVTSEFKPGKRAIVAVTILKIEICLSEVLDVNVIGVGEVWEYGVTEVSHNPKVSELGVPCRSRC